MFKIKTNELPKATIGGFEFDLQMFADDIGDTATEETGQYEDVENDGYCDTETIEQEDDGTLEETVQSDGKPAKWKVKLPDGEEEVTEEELIRGFMRQKDYTKKTQELAFERKLYEQFLNNQTKINDDVEEQEDIVESISQDAYNLFVHKYGREPEEFNNKDLQRLTTLSNLVYAERIQELESKKYEQYIQDIQHRTEEMLRTSEPNFEKVVETLLENLNAKEYNKIQEEVTKGKMDNYLKKFAEAQKTFYSGVKKHKNNNNAFVDNQRGKPPIVESPGNGRIQTKNTEFNAEKFRNADETARVEMLRRLRQAGKL